MNNIDLYDYQEVASSKVIKALQKFGRALMVMATGLGKTIVSASVVEFFLSPKKKHFRVLVLCHDTGILEQAFKKYQELFGTEYTYARFFGEKKNWNADKHTFVFATFQSNPHLFFKADHFDYIIVDESHHAKAETYNIVIDYFIAKWKLGMTATPDREDDEDIRLIFGHEVVNHSLAEGIAKGWLTYPDYKVLDDGLDNDVIQQLVQEVLIEKRRITMSQLNELLFIRMRTEEQCQRILSYTNTGLKAIVFCKNIAHLNHVMEMLPNSVAVHSDQSQTLNDAAMEMYVAGLVRHILVVDKFNEGIDLPDTDVLAFLRPTTSQRIWLQQLGRGLRKHLGKEKVTILDFVGNVERLKDVYSLSIEIGKFGTTVKGFDQNLLIDSPLHIEGSSFMFDFSEQVVNLLSVLEYVEKFEVYPTWQEASQAAIKIGIKSQDMYRQQYSQDPRLPSNPFNTYSDFPGFIVFLGKEVPVQKYQTWQEASLAVVKLGIESPSEYYSKEIQRYKEDPKLPAFPKQFYKNFPGNEIFFGKSRWPSEKELKQKCLDHFGNFDFTKKMYSSARTNFQSPSPNKFSSIYGKTFQEFFREKVKGSWPSEKELKQKCLDHFGNFDFVRDEYEKHKKVLKGPSTTLFPKIYGKTFQEFFKGSRKG